ncbi:AMP-binding protein [Granulosicoccus antarcticus]|uniref:Anguibactin system regulator n=1 Tax=Granulosicoccus antarcticus IMCC3135 TaxID=1192854 RepID=A0A2Z2P2J9_9GAMM|nr:AMP-binding protein [Granulosicoccus antarcticus]ASJ76851.1 Anguibactin system regulator [Granulosicoccus antarcticus IMCC3135]
MYYSLCSQPWLMPDDASWHWQESLSEHWVTPARLSALLPDARDWLSRHPGQRYLLHSDSALHFSAALLACWEQGKIVVLSPDEHPATLAALQSSTDQTIPTRLPARESHESALVSQPQARTMDASAIAVELHTSGTSGQPLKVVKHFSQLDNELGVHAALWPLTNACVISQVSHLHIYGLLTAILRPICEKVPFSNSQTRFPEVLLQHLIEVQQHAMPATIISSPAQLSRMPDEVLGTDVPPVTSPQRLFSSGAPLSQQDAIRSESLFGCEVIEIYGSTETGGIATRRQSQAAAWDPLPGVTISNVDDCLCVHSQFLENPSQPWMQADRIQLQGQTFTLLGRQDRIAKIAGKRVSLGRVERLLEDFDKVTQLRCIDLNPQHDRLGMVVAMSPDALPQTHAERQALQQQMQAHLARELDPISIPRYWRLVDSIPLNSQGKPDRIAISRLFADLYDRSLPRWLGQSRPDANTAICQLEVPFRLASLEGHFEGLPLVPGMVMVQWGCDLAAEAFAPLGDFRGLSRLKFQQILQPGQRLTLRVERKPHCIAFSVTSALGRHCMGQLDFSGLAEKTIP